MPRGRYQLRFLLCTLLLSLAPLLSSCNTVTSQSVTVTTPARQTATSVPTATPPPTAPPADEPALLVIPSIKINASIQPVGVNNQGDLAVPENNPWTEVGWYKAGPHPGELGSAVIDGHLDRPGGSPAVFWTLQDIRAGAEVQVTLKSGKLLHFHVTRTALYSPQNAPLQGIFGDTGGNYLNLITCAGDWIPSQHQTTLRMVVYTSLNA